MPEVPAFRIRQPPRSHLPVTPGALQPKPGSAYVVKLNPSGSTLLYASYLGGSGNSNTTNGQGLDAAGNLYIAGYTFATDFLTTSGAFQTPQCRSRGQRIRDEARPRWKAD